MQLRKQTEGFGVRAPVRWLPLAAAAFLAATTLAGCAVGPNYKRPGAPTVASWELAEPWREGAPKDAIPKGEWWSVFHDDDLNALETQALTANQSLKISLARLEQARAAAAIQVSAVYRELRSRPLWPSAPQHRSRGSCLPSQRRGPAKCSSAGHLPTRRRLFQSSRTGFRVGHFASHRGSPAEGFGVGEFAPPGWRGLRAGRRAGRDAARHHAHASHPARATAQTVRRRHRGPGRPACSRFSPVRKSVERRAAHAGYRTAFGFAGAASRHL